MTIKLLDWVSEQVPTTGTAGYECPANAKNAQVIFANCTNANAADASLTVHIIKASEDPAAPSEADTYFPSKSILAGTTDPVSSIVGAILMPGDLLVPLASNATRLNFKIGVKETY